MPLPDNDTLALLIAGVSSLTGLVGTIGGAIGYRLAARQDRAKLLFAERTRRLDQLRDAAGAYVSALHHYSDACILNCKGGDFARACNEQYGRVVAAETALMLRLDTRRAAHVAASFAFITLIEALATLVAEEEARVDSSAG